jgi:hypothetical protein
MATAAQRDSIHLIAASHRCAEAVPRPLDRSHSSLIGQWPLSKSRTNWRRCSNTFVSIQGILLV